MKTKSRRGTVIIRLALLALVFTVGFSIVCAVRHIGSAMPMNDADNEIVVQKELDDSSTNSDKTFNFRVSSKRTNINQEIAFINKDYRNIKVFDQGNMYISNWSGSLSIYGGPGEAPRRTYLSLPVNIQELSGGQSSADIPDVINAHDRMFLTLVDNWRSCSQDCPAAMRGNNILYYELPDYYYEEGFSSKYYPFDIIDGELYNVHVSPQRKLVEGVDYVTNENGTFYIKLAENVDRESFFNIARNMTAIEYIGKTYQTTVNESDRFISIIADMPELYLPVYGAGYKNYCSTSGIYGDGTEKFTLTEDGSFRFSMKAGESKTICIPQESDYEIWEETEDGWELVSINGDTEKKKVSEYMPKNLADNPNYIFINKELPPAPAPEPEPEVTPPAEEEKPKQETTINPQTGDRKMTGFVIMAGSAIVLAGASTALARRRI